MLDEIVPAEDLNQQQEAALETANEPEETIEEVKAKLAKAEEVAENQRIRAEKAEKKVKTEVVKPPKADGYTLKDSYALQEAKVHVDDIDEVADYAKFKNISITEALKTNAVKAILAEKAESRNVALAANTTTVRRGSNSTSDEVLIKNASEGKLPDDPTQLVAAQWRAKMKK